MTGWPMDLAVGKAEDGSVTVCAAVILPHHMAKQFPADVDHADYSAPGVRRMGPHVTVLYLKAQPSEVGQIQAAAAYVAGRSEPFDIELGGLDHFHNDDTVAFVHVRGQGLHDLRSDLMGEIASYGIVIEQTHQDYIPHATLGYLMPGTLWRGHVPEGRCTVDRFDLHTPLVVESMLLGSGDRGVGGEIDPWPADLAAG